MLTTDVQPVAGEEHGQQHGNDKLGHCARDPQNHSVTEVFENADIAGVIGRKELDVVVQTHKLRANLHQAVAIVHEQAVVKGHQLWDEGTADVRDEEGRDKYVSPLGVADAIAPG